MTVTKEDLEKAANVLRWLADQLYERAPKEALDCSMVASLCIHWAGIVEKKK